MEFWFQKVQEYNRINQDHIKVQYQVFSENYPTMIQSRMHTSEAPDIVVYTDTVFTTQRDSWLDLTPYMSEAFRKRFEAVMIENLNVFDGACYYIPTGVTTCRLIYNQTLFDRAGISGPPQTMEEMIDIAHRITHQFQDEEIYGFAMNLKNADSAWNRCLVKQVNLELGLKNGYNFAKGVYDFTGYESLLSAYRQLLSPECAYPYCDSLDIDPLRILFAQGKIGMYFSYSHAEQGAYQFQYPMEDDWGMAPLPTVSGKPAGAQNYTLNNGWLINAEAHHPDVAWKVYEDIFANPAYLTEYYASGLGVPALSDLKQDWQNGQQNLLLLAQDYEKLWPRTPDELAGTRMNSLEIDQYELFKNLVLDQEAIGPALQKLTEQYNTMYRTLMDEGEMQPVILENFNPWEPSLQK